MRAEGLDLAHARQTADRILYHAGVVVGEVRARHAAVLGDQADDDEEIAHRLVHLHALLLHLLREERRGEGDFVLHLHLRDIRIGAAFKGDRDRHRAVRSAR